MSLELINALKREESYRQFAYYCTANKLTIGYGTNIDPDKSGPGIPEHIALLLLREHVLHVDRDLWDNIPEIMSKLPGAMKDALNMMAYQLGVAGLLKFKKTMALLNDGEYELASEEVLRSKWAKQTPRRAKLVSYIFKNNSYPED